MLIARFRARTGGLRDERGFTMFAVVGAMLAIMMLSVAAYATVGGDQDGARRDQDSKRAYAAAEAGVQYYLSRLNQNNAFWTLCDQVPPPAIVNQPWNGSGADPRRRMRIPGSGRGIGSGLAEYALEMLPAKDLATGQRRPACDPNNSGATMIDPLSGTFQIRSTGFVPQARGWVKRSVIATFRKKGFLDFLYFTDFETANPVTYRVQTGGYPPIAPDEDVQTWATRECGKWYRNGRGSANYSAQIDENGTTRRVDFGCTEINFVTGDFIKGPLHTNDEMLVCGDPVFGRTNQDMIEASANPGWRGNGGCGSDNPTFTGKYSPGAGVLGFPPSNSKLKQIADPAYVFTGKTDIELVPGNNVKVNGSLMASPPNGLIYVQSGSCGVFYDPIATEKATSPAGCGDAYVHGDYTSDLTIAAEKDIVVDGDIRNTGDAMLGLIANNFVRVNHPVVNRTKNWSGSRFSWDCDNDPSEPSPNRIDAAILALNYSFIVDNWYCGNALGDLTVNGVIAQKYRGIVGTFGSRDTGYKKDYNYDNRLKFRQPPNFLDPVQTAWRVMRQVEQTPPL